MKAILSLLGVVLSLAFSASGITFSGTIHGTVSSISGPGDHSASPWEVGDSITGWYQYESATMDGTFYGGANPSAVLSGRFSYVNFEEMYNQNCYIVVSGGIVSHAAIDGEQINNWWMSNTSFDLEWFDSLQRSIYVTGPLTFSNPSASVPDSSSSGVMLAGALALLGFMRSCAKHERRV